MRREFGVLWAIFLKGLFEGEVWRTVGDFFKWPFEGLVLWALAGAVLLDRARVRWGKGVEGKRGFRV